MSSLIWIIDDLTKQNSLGKKNNTKMNLLNYVSDNNNNNNFTTTNNITDIRLNINNNIILNIFINSPTAWVTKGRRNKNKKTVPDLRKI